MSTSDINNLGGKLGSIYSTAVIDHNHHILPLSLYINFKATDNIKNNLLKIVTEGAL